MAGTADDNVPVASSARYYASHIHDSKLVLLEGGVRHYEFLATCTALGHQRLPLLCSDKPGVDRDAIHQKTAAMAVEFFDATSGQPGSEALSEPGLAAAADPECALTDRPRGVFAHYDVGWEMGSMMV